jgi:hypothetical protein
MSSIQLFTPDQMMGMARAFVDSGMFGVKDVAGAYSLLLIAQAEGMHPAKAMQDYHVIQGKPSLKSDAMLARFQRCGGVVEWQEVSDKRVAAAFSHPESSPKPVTIEWTDETVTQAQLSGNPMHKKYPRQMKRARVISEGVRTVYPAAISGFYTPEEVVDFTPNQEPPPEVVKDAVVSEPDTSEVIKDFSDSLPEAGATQSEPEPPREVVPLHANTKMTCGFGGNEGMDPIRKTVAQMDDDELEKAAELAREHMDGEDAEKAFKAECALASIEIEQQTRIADLAAAEQVRQHFS